MNNYKDFFKKTDSEQKDIMNQLHYIELKSVADIAELFGTYPNKLRRLAKKIEFDFRDRSEAQKNALQTGKTEHPTLGKKRPDSVKKEIGNKIQGYWKNLTPAELAERVEISRDNWEKMSDEEKENIHNLAAKARLVTAKTGSKLEKDIQQKLIEAGYKVSFHMEHALANEKLQLDLFIPELRVAIEIDGPTHFLPIYGEEHLKKVQQTDFQKDALILNAGCCIIRLRQQKNISRTFVDKSATKLIKVLEQIKKEFPKQGNRKFIIEE